MDEAVRAKFHELSERIVDATHVVSNLVDAEHPDLQEIGRANGLVQEIADAYNALYAQLPEAERGHAERTHGRRVTDLRRLASKLPQRASGQRTKKAVDAGQPFLLTREPPRSIEPPRVTPVPRNQPKYKVGGEVEAWCGTCGGLTDHAIVAMVSGEPKQVICNTCHAKHGYRTSPARKSATGTPAAVDAAAGKRSPSREEVEAQKREEARFALLKELAEATEVKEFMPRAHYRPGDIVAHPEHGRGKVENVLKGSMLVRFRDGLKSVSLL